MALLCAINTFKVCVVIIKWSHYAHSCRLTFKEGLSLFIINILWYLILICGRNDNRQVKTFCCGGRGGIWSFSSMCSYSTTQWVAFCFCFCFVCSYFSYSGPRFPKASLANVDREVHRTSVVGFSPRFPKASLLTSVVKTLVANDTSRGTRRAPRASLV